MEKNKILNYVRSFIILPILATTAFPAVSTMNPAIAPIVEQQKAEIIDPMDILRKERAQKIDTYFKERDMPLEGYGMKMVLEAEKNDLDWRLLPGIAVRESTGGKHACKKVKNSPFGWGSCKISFKTMNESIETVARNLGGNNPNTAHYYDNKTTEAILKAYNPPSIVPKYTKQVLAIMNNIQNQDIIDTDSQVATLVNSNTI